LAKWHWEEIDPSRSSTSGDVSKLDELATRHARISEQPAIADALGSDCFGSLRGGGPLQCLVISERAACGMHGPWRGPESKLYRALLSVGFANETGGAGGSFGYGKAGLIGASALRTVIAYTCFRERPDDPGITRRLLGATYWGQHSDRDSWCTGFATLGAQGAGAVPLSNDQADDMARQLGLDVRDPGQISDLGTTMLVVEPTVEPTDLLTAVERSWWPALEDSAQRFNVVIRSQDGTRLVPRPKRDEVLASFIDAYELATMPAGKRESCKRVQLRGAGYDRLGVLGMVSDPGGWSFPDADPHASPDDAAVDHRSLIALMRDPRMVVEYLDSGRKDPFVRGVFVADESVNDVLRSTEPKAHDSWQPGETENKQVAQGVLERIRRHVDSYRKDLRPPSPPPESIDLPFVDRLMRKLMSSRGRRPVGPHAENRDVSINLRHHAEPTADGRIELHGEATVGFSEHFEGDRAQVEVAIGYRYLEEDRLGERVDLAVEAPPGWVTVADDINCFSGELVRGADARFVFFSTPYAAEWTGKLIVNANVVGEGSS